MTKPTKQYFSLIERDDVDGRWSIQFGDYDREVVAQELIDVAYSQGRPRRAFKIIKTADDQASIFAAVADLNRAAPVAA